MSSQQGKGQPGNVWSRGSQEGAVLRRNMASSGDGGQGPTNAKTGELPLDSARTVSGSLSYLLGKEAD